MFFFAKPQYWHTMIHTQNGVVFKSCVLRAPDFFLMETFIKINFIINKEENVDPSGIWTQRWTGTILACYTSV